MRFRILIFLICILYLFPMLLMSQIAEKKAVPVLKPNMACDDSSWAIVKKSKDVQTYNEFLEACPGSRWAVLARHLMKSLQQADSQNKQKRVSLSTKHDVDW